MSDYELLKTIHDNLPKNYQDVLRTSLKSFAGYVVSGGSEEDKRAKDLFKQFWVMYFIFHYQRKKKYFEFWDLMSQSYEYYQDIAINLKSKITEGDSDDK